MEIDTDVDLILYNCNVQEAKKLTYITVDAGSLKGVAVSTPNNEHVGHHQHEHADLRVDAQRVM